MTVSAAGASLQQQANFGVTDLYVLQDFETNPNARLPIIIDPPLIEFDMSTDKDTTKTYGPFTAQFCNGIPIPDFGNLRFPGGTTDTSRFVFDDTTKEMSVTLSSVD